LHFSKSHFGFGADKTRNLFFGSFPGFVRMFAASPVKLADGKSWELNEGAVWMFIRVPSSIKDKFLAAVASELHSPAFPQNLVTRERNVLSREEAEEEEDSAEDEALYEALQNGYAL
jgi:hypothetical protein